MTEHPVFVPVGERHVAAVVTVPDGEPRGVVLLVTGGGGARRSHRYGLWTRVARALVERGIASVRFEWPGVGDSTGTMAFALDDLPLEETAAVARFAVAATGVDRVGMLGNCGGARTIVRLAPSLPCESLALVLLSRGTATARNPTLRRSRTLARRLPRVARRAIGGVYRGLRARSRRREPVKAALLAVPRSTDVLLMEPPTPWARDLSGFVASLPGGENGRRVEVRDLPSATMAGFSTRQSQRYLVDSVVEWFDRSFTERAPGLAGRDHRA